MERLRSALNAHQIDKIWDGPFQTGTAVRVIGTSYGSGEWDRRRRGGSSFLECNLSVLVDAAGVEIGDVGIVRGRDAGDGALILSFHSHTHWRAKTEDVDVDVEADRVSYSQRHREPHQYNIPHHALNSSSIPSPQKIVALSRPLTRSAWALVCE